MLSARPIPLNADIDTHAYSNLNAKTPGRKGKARNALQENAFQSGAKTVLTKKNILQTPFRPGTAHGKKPLISASVTRPLMDKTPFPNRVASGNFGNAGKTPGLKLSKIALLVPEAEQESLSPDVAPLLRPSSTRRSLRGRLSQNFKTPLTKGNHWDVSPEDMEGIDGALADDAKPETETAVADEEDEVEYMPPTAIECPYEPPFEMPDYKAMGHSLFALGHSGLIDDTADAFYAADIEEQIDVKALVTSAGLNAGSSSHDLEVLELEDDSPFPSKPPATKSERVAMPKSAAISLTRTSSSRTAPSSTRAQSRPTTAIPTTRSSARPTPTNSTIVPAPGQTRTSALRAAKAAAANSATTPAPIRPIARSGSATASGTSLKNPSGIPVSRPRPTPGARSTPAPVPASTARPRSATTLGRAKSAGTANGAGMAKNKEVEDALALQFETEFGGSGEDFQFEV